ncbi:CLUMA_CG002795, isoform A [Clunio marinus]|uniref:CLUMA_CG002795, isoform A n=1 Tax=Clunio marinus TaxID=568069 RepID=A0A1J1HLX6_9DIPT|nr:CLUMA_CG002795, isoform A [Clunio marinus]
MEAFCLKDHQRRQHENRRDSYEEQKSIRKVKILVSQMNMYYTPESENYGEANDDKPHDFRMSSKNEPDNVVPESRANNKSSIEEYVTTDQLKDKYSASNKRKRKN